MRFTGEPCTAYSPHACSESHADIRLHRQGALYKTIGCLKDYKNEFDFSKEHIINFHRKKISEGSNKYVTHTSAVIISWIFVIIAVGCV